MKHRTALITAGSIAAVFFAGAVAAGANLGILTVSDARPIGDLSVAAIAQATEAQPAQAKTKLKAAAKEPGTQTYVIKKAGTIKIAFTKSHVSVAGVTAKSHWKWQLAQSGNRKLSVTFKHGSATYVFVAVVDKNGKLRASVNHPVTRVVPSSASANPAGAAPATYLAPAPASAASSGGSASGQSGTGSSEEDAHAGEGDSHDGGDADD